MAAASLTPRSLKGVGQGIVLGVPEVPTGKNGIEVVTGQFTGMSIQDMEDELKSKPLRRPPPFGTEGRELGAPLTARALLEENKQLIAEKESRRAMARKNSQEEFEKLILQDRQVIECDKARQLNRRMAQRELAEHYKERICDRERSTSKTAQYEVKRQQGTAISYFPFVEGETVDMDRKAKSAQMRQEMLGFLKAQRAQRPPRMDKLLTDVKGVPIHYPVQPVSARMRPSRPSALAAGARASSEQPAERLVEPPSESPEPSDYLKRHPRFLTRPSEHMSRRLADGHVRQALEDKVMQTKAELEAAARERELETQKLNEGVLVGDAKRKDREVAAKEERLRNAVALREQIEQRQRKAIHDKQATRSEAAGYWGPEDKNSNDPDTSRAHCADLIKQMEVDQYRKHHDKGQRLRQEKQMIDNCIAEMSQDRAKEREKQRAHKEVLTTTWESQRKIKQALSTLDKV